jgi:hypothetical protein
MIKFLKHEELLRQKEDEPFQSDIFIIETFCQKKVLVNMNSWIENKLNIICRNQNKAFVFVVNFKGHFVVVLALNIEISEGRHENSILLINSIADNSIESLEEIIAVKNLVF